MFLGTAHTVAVFLGTAHTVARQGFSKPLQGARGRGSGRGRGRGRGKSRGGREREKEGKEREGEGEEEGEGDGEGDGEDGARQLQAKSEDLVQGVEASEHKRVLDYQTINAASDY